MQQMARRPFMKNTMGQNRAARQEPRKSRFPTSKNPVLRPWLIIVNLMGLSNEGGSPIPLVVPCDSLRRLSSSSPSSRRRLHPPKPAFSSSPTRATAMGSTNALPTANAAARRPHALIANHGILRRPPPTGVSIPTRLPVRFPRPPAPVRAVIATNTSRLPASADGIDDSCRGSAIWSPRKRRAVAETAGYGLSLGVVISRDPCDRIAQDIDRSLHQSDHGLRRPVGRAFILW